jgi:hypothetical protein
VRISERGVRVDGTLKALRDAEVRSFHHCRVEGGGGARKVERKVYLQRNRTHWGLKARTSR